MPRRAEVPTSDAELQAACLKGDERAWDTLVNRYGALIYSIPLKYGFGEADAADVFQAVCITLLEKLGSIREPSRARGLDRYHHQPRMSGADPQAAARAHAHRRPRRAAGR